MSRKKSTFGAIAVLALGMMVAAGAISASSGESGNHGANALVGSWDATVDRGPAFPSLRTLHTFTRDGSMVETGSDTMFRSPAIGSWMYIGNRTFATTMVMHRFSPTGQYLGTGKINANRRLSDDGQTYTAVAVLELRDPDGNLIVSGLRSTAIGKRIDVEGIPGQP
jgi:hypothetical protein